MNTDELIEALSRNLEPAPKPRDHARRMALLVVGGVAVSLLLLLVVWGVRDAFGAHIPEVLAKAAFSAALAGAALPLVVRLARPGARLGVRLLAPVVAIGASLLIAAITLIGTNPADRAQAWLGGGFPWCLLIVPILATPIAAGMIWFVRSMAPTRLALAGGAIGGFAGGLAAMVYAMYCPVDSVAFVATWYALAIAFCAAIGALLGSALLRW
jgi:hypothetical protein